MKYLIASDIHGSAYWAERLCTAIESEQPDRIVLLGDLLYHGPRNDLPDEYAPKQVLAMLNERRDRLFCVRGNCDIGGRAPDTDIVPLGPVKAFITHGHLFNVKYGRLDSLVYAAMEHGARIAMFGHTHEVLETYDDGLYILTPGSCSGFRATCGLVDISPAGILTNILHIN